MKPYLESLGSRPIDKLTEQVIGGRNLVMSQSTERSLLLLALLPEVIAVQQQRAAAFHQAEADKVRSGMSQNGLGPAAVSAPNADAEFVTNAVNNDVEAMPTTVAPQAFQVTVVPPNVGEKHISSIRTNVIDAFDNPGEVEETAKQANIPSTDIETLPVDQLTQDRISKARANVNDSSSFDQAVHDRFAA